jgi:hypothetical protein
VIGFSWIYRVYLDSIMHPLNPRDQQHDSNGRSSGGSDESIFNYLRRRHFFIMIVTIFLWAFLIGAIVTAAISVVDDTCRVGTYIHTYICID